MFSINRFSLQFKILVYQNYKKHGLFMLIYALYLVFVHFKFFNSTMISAEYPFSSFGFVVSLASVFFIIDVFSKLRASTGSGITYLMTPATTFEKFISAWVYSTILTFLAFLSTYLIVHVISTTFGNTVNHMAMPLHIPELNELWETGSDMLFFQSLYFLGAVLFRKNPFGKTTAVIVGFIVIASIIGGLILKYTMEGADDIFNNNVSFNINGNLDGYTINGIPMSVLFEDFKKFIIICTYILPLACWTGAFFRLKTFEI